MASGSVYIDDLVAPCPECGGKVQLMAMYDHPPELGGDWEMDFLLCMSCKHEWIAESAPPEFSSPNREYWLTSYIAINGIGDI